jgi:hypothetical protein
VAVDETSRRDFDEPMSPQVWRSWQVWAGYKDQPADIERSPKWPLAFVIWLMLGFVALASWIRAPQ